MLESIILTATNYWHFVFPAIIVAYLTANYFKHGLNKYPGPFLASLTDIWRFIDVWNRRPDITQLSLHRKHGDVVRLGPNTITFSDPAAIKTIYGLNKGFVKVHLYIIPSSSFGCTLANILCSPASIHLNKPSPVVPGSPPSSAQPTNLTTPLSAAASMPPSPCLPWSSTNPSSMR